MINMQCVALANCMAGKSALWKFNLGDLPQQSWVIKRLKQGIVRNLGKRQIQDVVRTLMLIKYSLTSNQYTTVWNSRFLCKILLEIEVSEELIRPIRMAIS